MKGKAIQLEPSTIQDKVFKPVFNVLRNAQGLIVSGFSIDATQAQNEALILASSPGEFKNSPTLGVGLDNSLLSDSDLLPYRGEVRRCYAMDGLEIIKLDLFKLDKIDIKARYK